MAGNRAISVPFGSDANNRFPGLLPPFPPHLLPLSMRPKSPITIPIVLITLFVATVAHAQDTAVAAPEITADRLDMAFETGEAIYSGHARATFGTATLTADEMRWNRTAQTVTASGQATLDREGARLLAPEIVYHLDAQTYEVTDLRFGTRPLFVSSSRVTGDATEIVFEDALVSIGEPGRWAPTFRANRLTYYPERERIRAAGGRLGLGVFQPLPFPSTELPTDIPFIEYLSFFGGYRSTLGAQLEIGARVPMNDSVNVGADLGIFTKRGLMFGPTASYSWSGDDTSAARGSLSTGFISDTGNRLTDVLGRAISRERGFAHWEHRQTLGPELSFNASFKYWSDSEVVRDFRSREFFPVQAPDNFAEATYQSGNIVAGLFLRLQPNDFHEIRQRQPELYVDLLPTPIGQGFVHEAHAAAVALRDNPPGPGPEIRSDRLDAYYGISRPTALAPWLVVNPVAGVRATHYGRTTGDQGDYTRTLGELGFDADLHISGVFDYQNERWGIDGLRHLITPSLSYRYVPDADKGRGRIPQIDRRVFATYFEPLALGARRQIDDLTDSNTLRLAVKQRLQTRDGRHGSRDLALFNMAVDSRFDRAPGERTLSALHSELRLTPAPWLEFELYHRATPGDWVTRELNTAVTLRSADRWRLRFANHYLAGDIQEFIGGFAYRLNEVYEGYTRFHYDSRRDRWVEQTFGVSQTLGNRWVVGYELSFYGGPRRESDFGFNIVLEALAF